MFDTSGALGFANGPIEWGESGESGRLAAAAGPEQDFRFPGLAAGVIWSIGLLIGVIAFVTGHAWVAVVALGAAVLAPWFALAWVSHAHREAYNVALPSLD